MKRRTRIDRIEKKESRDRNERREKREKREQRATGERRRETGRESTRQYITISCRGFALFLWPPSP